MRDEKSFVDKIEKFIQSGGVTLPVFNPNALSVQREMARAEPDMQTVERLITRDQALAGEVLRIANSSYYRGLVEVKTVKSAIVRLGLHEIGRIVLLASTRNQFASHNPKTNLMLKRLWQHSAGCGLAAHWLARRCNYENLGGPSFFAGLLHDIGKLLIFMVIEQMRLTRSRAMTESLMLEVVDGLHTREGYRLLQMWNMPEEYCVVVRDHHNEELDFKNTLLLLVRVADMACHKLSIGATQRSSLNLAATAEVELLELTELDIAELEIMLEDTTSLFS